MSEMQLPENIPAKPASNVPSSTGYATWAPKGSEEMRRERRNQAVARLTEGCSLAGR